MRSSLVSALGAAAALACLVSAPAVQAAAAGKIMFAAEKQAVSEAAGQVVVTVKRSGGSSGATSVSYTTADASATTPGDYVLTKGVLTWASGDAADKTITIMVREDTVSEKNEVFRVQLSSLTGAPVAKPTVDSITIVDNDVAQATGPGRISFRNSTSLIAENGGQLQIAVKRTEGSTGIARVNYQTVNGTAKSGSDFTAGSGSLIWLDGDSADKLISVSVLNDSQAEASETFSVSLSDASGATLLAPTRNTVTITDNDSGAFVCPAPGVEKVLFEWQGKTAAAIGGTATASDPLQPFTLPAACTVSSMTVAIAWDNTAEDLDLDLTKPDNTVEPSQNGGSSEALTLANPAAGTYKAKVYGFISTGTQFRGTVTVTGSGPVITACADGVDNDGDGLKDFPADPGCDNAADNDEINVIVVPPTGDVPRVVVADIDSGINVFHKFYYEGSPIYPPGYGPSSVTTGVLQEFGIDTMPACQVDARSYSGTIEQRRTNLAAYLAAQTACPVFWFKGTNIIAKAFSAGALAVLPNDEEDTHGVGTSAAVLTANPEAILFFLESGANVTENAPIESAAFTHPAVDIVTTSYGYGPVFGLPIVLNQSYEGVATYGKIHVGSCDNAPTPAPVTSGTCGPWWVVGVAGFEEIQSNEPSVASNGRQAGSGQLPDFVGDYTQTLPYCAACDDGYADGVGGTSFATPRSAGTISRILLRARRSANHLRGIDQSVSPARMVNANGVSITNWQLRRALEESAWIPGLGDYDPVAAGFELADPYLQFIIPLVPNISVPVPPVAPWTVAGWGIISPTHGDVVDQTLAHLGVLTAADVGGLRAKSADHCDFQATLFFARETHWDNTGYLFNSFMGNVFEPGTTPYIYCSQGNIPY